MNIPAKLAALLALPILAQSPIGSLDKLPDPRKMPVGLLRSSQLKLQSFTMPNGIRVLFIEDHELPVVRISTAFKAGSLEDPPDKAGLASMTAKLLRNGGTQRFTSAQLDRSLEDMAAEIEWGAAAEMAIGGIHCFKRIYRMRPWPLGANPHGKSIPKRLQDVEAEYMRQTRIPAP